MELDEGTVSLPRTAKKWRAGAGIDDVEETLLQELTDQAPDLTGEACTYTGGWSDDEEVEILDLRLNEQQLDAKIRIGFTELRPSGCSDMPHRDRRAVEYLLTMQREDDSAFVKDSGSNPDHWDLWDRNSAADGT